MTIVVVAPPGFPASWRETFDRTFSREGVQWWPDARDKQHVECVVFARAQQGILPQFPNLRLISSTGMGVDHILALSDLPSDIPVVRVVGRAMVQQVAEYATLAVLRVERDSDHFDNCQKRSEWARRFEPRRQGRLRAGLLGFGAIGQEIARQLLFFRFEVAAWTRTPKEGANVVTFQGRRGLQQLCGRSDILINALPATEKTVGIINKDVFQWLPLGAHLINVGRGNHLVEEHLLAALDAGHISGATLDVFQTEPLPPSHPFWSHPQVRVTPHSAGVPDPNEIAKIILSNLQMSRNGQTLQHQVDRGTGY